MGNRNSVGANERRLSSFHGEGTDENTPSDYLYGFLMSRSFNIMNSIHRNILKDNFSKRGKGQGHEGSTMSLYFFMNDWKYNEHLVANVMSTDDLLRFIRDEVKATNTEWEEIRKIVQIAIKNYKEDREISNNNRGYDYESMVKFINSSQFDNYMFEYEKESVDRFFRSKLPIVLKQNGVEPTMDGFKSLPPDKQTEIRNEAQKLANLQLRNEAMKLLNMSKDDTLEYLNNMYARYFPSSGFGYGFGDSDVTSSSDSESESDSDY